MDTKSLEYILEISRHRSVPKMSRRNALYIRPGMEMGQCELFLADAIRNYKLFKK